MILGFRFSSFQLYVTCIVFCRPSYRLLHVPYTSFSSFCTVFKNADVGPASMIVGNLVAGKRIAQASGRDVTQLEDNDQARKVTCPDLTKYLHWLIQNETRAVVVSH